MIKIIPRESSNTCCCSVAQIGKVLCDVQLKRGTKLYKLLHKFGWRYNKERVRVNAIKAPRDYKIQGGEVIIIVPIVRGCRCKNC